MLSSTLTLAALSTGHEIGLALVAAAFIVFALVSSFVLPRFNANFPGRGLAVYAAVAVCFFVAMIAAVVVLGREKPEKAEAAPPAATTTNGGGGGGAGGGGGGGGAAAPQGNPAKGAVVFKSAGCSGCHTLKAAHANGTVGPNLDQLKPAEDVVVHQVINGGGAMPAFKGRLSPTQIQNVAAYVYASTH
jgi:mono/diheme cytochrome c family protein